MILRNKKRALISVISTLVIITMLIFSGPVSAVTVGITGISAAQEGNSIATFTVYVDIEANERIPVQNMTIDILNTGGKTNYTCTFDTAGTKLTACTNLNITRVNAVNWGYEALYGYGFGYYFNGSGWVTAGTNFSATNYGYGYGYDSSGYGNTSYPYGELSYNISWAVPDYNVTYNMTFYATVNASGITRTYQTLTPRQITVSGCYFGDWGSWSTCSAYTQTRTRECSCTLTSQCGTGDTSQNQTCSMGSTSGPSGGGTPSNTESSTSHLWSEIPADTPTSMTISSDTIPVTDVVFTIIAATTNAQLTVASLKAAPSTPVSMGGSVYKYLEITASNIASENIKETKIKFKVTKAWLTEKSAKESDVALFRYVTGTGWVELSTAKLSADDTYTYYEAASPGFSYFAIGIKGTAPVVEKKEEEVKKIAEEEKPAVTGEVTKEVEEGKEPVKKEVPWTLITWLIVIIVIVVLAAVVIAQKKKIEQR